MQATVENLARSIVAIDYAGQQKRPRGRPRKDALRKDALSNAATDSELKQALVAQFISCPIPQLPPDHPLIPYRDAIFPNLLNANAPGIPGRPSNQQREENLRQSKPEVIFLPTAGTQRSKIPIVYVKEQFDIASQWNEERLATVRDLLAEKKGPEIDHDSMPKRIEEITAFVFNVGTGRFLHYNPEAEVTREEMLDQIDALLRRFKHKPPFERNLGAAYLEAAYAARVAIWHLFLATRAPKKDSPVRHSEVEPAREPRAVIVLRPAQEQRTSAVLPRHETIFEERGNGHRSLPWKYNLVAPEIPPSPLAPGKEAATRILPLSAQRRGQYETLLAALPQDGQAFADANMHTLKSLYASLHETDGLVEVFDGNRAMLKAITFVGNYLLGRLDGYDPTLTGLTQWQLKIAAQTCIEASEQYPQSDILLATLFMEGRNALTSQLAIQSAPPLSISPAQAATRIDTHVAEEEPSLAAIPSDPGQTPDIDEEIDRLIREAEAASHIAHQVRATRSPLTNVQKPSPTNPSLPAGVHGEERVLQGTTMNATADNAYRRLQLALSKLNENDRAFIDLRFFQGKSPTEIGQALGRSEAAVRTHQSRLITRLLSLLDATSRRNVRETYGSTADVIAGLWELTGERRRQVSEKPKKSPREKPGLNRRKQEQATGRIRALQMQYGPLFARAVTMLPTVQREAMLLIAQGKSYDDMERELDCTRQTLRVRVFFGLKNIPVMAEAAKMGYISLGEITHVLGFSREQLHGIGIHIVMAQQHSWFPTEVIRYKKHTFFRQEDREKITAYLTRYVKELKTRVK